MYTFNGDRKDLRNSRLTRNDCRFGTTGVDCMRHLVNRLEQDILQAKTMGDTLAYNSQNQKDIPEFRWDGSDLVMDGSQVVLHNRDRGDYRFGIDTALSLKMK